MRETPEEAMSDLEKFLGAAAAVAGIYVAQQYARLATGVAGLDAFKFRWPALFWSKWLSSNDLPTSSQAQDGTVYRIADPRAVMVVLHNEGAYTPGADGTYPLGEDGDNSYGGPGQLTKAFAPELGYDPSQGDLMQPGNESLAVKYVVLGLLRKMVVNGTDDLDTAIQAYNGSGPAAQQYLANAESFAQEAYGDTV
jgi:hypothetical protein